VLRRRLRRAEVLKVFAGIEPALVGIEACHTAHYWAREIAAFGHEVRLMPPQFVKPYIKSQKNGAADVEAICEAVQRPTMRFVPVKNTEQQAVLLLHRTRDLFDSSAQQFDQRNAGTFRGIWRRYSSSRAGSTGYFCCLARRRRAHQN
jgi:transposase